MANFRAQFENELRQKLQQKATSHTSEQTVLLRAFKYFDLDNSQCVSFNQFTKAIEKIGVVVQDSSQLRSIFDYYDQDQSGALDYKEFTGVVFGEKTLGARGSPQKSSRLSSALSGQEVVEKLRQRLAARGGRGIIGLARQFKIMDDDNSHSLEMPEFIKAIRDFRVDVSEQEAQTMFNYIDRNHSGSLDYDEFLRAVRGPMNNFRRGLVRQAFNKMDRDQSGVLDINDIRGVYNARGHPDVRSGKKTEDEILGEFLQTFEMHHNINGGRDRRVTMQEFMEYYNNVSSSIDNDQYFELMMNNTWKLTQAPAYTRNQAWSNKEETKAPRGGIQRPERPAAVRNAPPSRSNAAPTSRSAEILFDKFRTKLASRGARGIIGIQRQFKIMDDDNSKSLCLPEFRKACRDFRIEIEDSEIERLFACLDRDRGGTIDYDELIRGIRGPMNNFRKQIVGQAWNRLDRDGSGIIDIDDIRGVYSAKQHPDVRSGKKTEDDILGEFLQTFETHHNISDLSLRDRRVTKQEFEEYYNNVSASIDDDRYFELMMNNAWKLQGAPPKREAWGGQYSMRDARGTRGSAPFGVEEGPSQWTTSSRPPQQGDLRSSNQMKAAGQTMISERSGSSKSAEGLLANLRQKLAARGARGFIGMQRQFKIMDDNNSKSLDAGEFSKAMRDFRIEISPDDVKTLFAYMDADRSGEIQYEEFVYRLRGELNQFRLRLVQQAFQKLDKTGNGVVDIEDIRGVYNARQHPDVVAGKKTEDEILCDFLDTFEQHHATFKEDTRDHRITFEEFCEYYKNVSASVDDDRYFELMMNNAWNFAGKTYERGWGADMTGPARRQR